MFHVSALNAGRGLPGQVAKKREEYQQQEREERGFPHPGTQASEAALRSRVLTFCFFPAVETVAAIAASEGALKQEQVEHIAPPDLTGAADVGTGTLWTRHV